MTLARIWSNPEHSACPQGSCKCSACCNQQEHAADCPPTIFTQETSLIRTRAARRRQMTPPRTRSGAPPGLALRVPRAPRRAWPAPRLRHGLQAQGLLSHRQQSALRVCWMPTKTRSWNMTVLHLSMRWRWRTRLHRKRRRRRESRGRPAALTGDDPGDQAALCPLLEHVAVLTTPMPGIDMLC